MKWIKVKTELPKLTNAHIDNGNGKWKSSEYVWIAYEKSRKVSPRFGVAKLEKGDGFEHWYCPFYDDIIAPPDFFSYIDELPEQ